MSKKQKLDRIQKNMKEIIRLMNKGYSQDDAAKELGLDPNIVKQWYDKGWHNEGGDLYINFFKSLREIKYSNKSSKRKNKRKNKNTSQFSNLSKNKEEKILSDFNKLLNSHEGYIDNFMRKVFKNKFYKGNTNYYYKLGLSRLIDNHNKKVIEEEKIVVLDDFNSFLSSQEEYIDESVSESLKNKYKKKYFNYYNYFNMESLIDDYNDEFIENEKNTILTEFNSFLSSYDGFIDESVKKSLRNKYDKRYYNYYSRLKMDSLIDKHNADLINKEKCVILEEFNDLLDSQDVYIDDAARKSFKKKFNKNYYNYYENLNMDVLIDDYNKEFIENFKKGLEDKYISNSEKLKLVNSLNYNFDVNFLIDEHNDEYIKKTAKLNKDYFENIAGRSLDSDQIRAVLTDDDNTQIVAGAGTGKTLTLQAKVKYLIEKQGILPSEILCISFSNSARDDLAEKLEKTLGGNIVDVRTFHSIGYKILGMNDDNRDVPNGKIDELIDYFFKDIVVDKPELVKDVIEFFSYYYDIIYLNQNKLELETIKSKLNRLDEFDEFLREQMNIIVGEEKEEYVNSIHELIVANYLFIHNISYELKKELVYDVEEDLNNNYFSNFYLPENDIYINLLSLCPDENTEKLKIIDIAKNDSTKIINIYNYGEDIESILKVLEDELIKYKVNIDEIDYLNLFNLLIIEKNLVEYKNFIKTVKTFINLFKGNAEYIDENGNNISQLKFKNYQKENSEKFNGSIEKRNKFFLAIIQEIYEIYTNSLEEYDYIDFDDMINDAVIALKNGAKIDNYKYIIVDEYQDTSHTRYNLLKEMQNSTGAKVVVVGDDWQSIYGFTGCDISLFSNFDKYFENPKMVKIQVTYRNSQNLIDVVGDFIQMNKNLIPKKLISAKKTAKKLNEKPIKLVGYVSRAEKVLSLINIIDEIAEKNEDAKILILGRNNADIFEISCKDIFTFIEEKDYTKIIYQNNPKLNIEFRTVHKAKGLEADYVMVLNLTDKLNGFPNKMLNDPVLDFVTKKNNENIDYPEERRLFYVALTRTENDVYLFHNDISPSIFIDQIKSYDKVKNLKFVFSNEEIHQMNLLLNKKYEVIGTRITCPECNSGEIILIVNNEKGTSGFKCSNRCGWDGGSYHNVNKGERARKIAYLKYAKVCTWCNHMMLVTPQNKNPEKKFMGCNHFPICDHAHDLPKDFVDIDKTLNKLSITKNDVYNLYKYVPEKKLKDASADEIEIHDKILTYKDGDDETIISSLTNEIMEAITFIVNYKMDMDVKKIVLVAIPSSKVLNRKKSTMRKTINIIEKWHKSGIAEHNFGCKKTIVNQKDLLKRIEDVPTAHLGEGRANCKQHVKSIECDDECIVDDETAYIILDDITTTGASMKAGKQILMDMGVKKENIYSLVIGATIGDNNEKI